MGTKFVLSLSQTYCYLNYLYVLQGELYVEDIDIESGKVINSKTRNVGDYATKEGGDVHMEKGGPEGAIVLFSLIQKMVA